MKPGYTETADEVCLLNRGNLLLCEKPVIQIRIGFSVFFGLIHRKLT